MPDNQHDDVDGSDAVIQSSLEWGTSSFEPGPDVGLVARHTVGLIERANPSTRDRLWRLVADDAPLDDILDELSSTGLKALPDFGLAQTEGTSVRVVARGRATISAELSSGDVHEIDPSGVRTWIEEVVDDIVALTITLPALDGDEVPEFSSEAFAVLAGSVPASTITRRFDVADAHAAEAVAGWSAAPEWSSDVDADEEPADGPGGPSAPDVTPDPDEPEADAEVGDAWLDDEASAPDAASILPQSDIAGDAHSASPPPPDAAPASPQPAAPPAGSAFGGPPTDATVVVDSDDGPTRGPDTSIFQDDDFAPAATAVGAEHDDASVAGSAIGVLAFSNGVRIAVDRNVLIGRNPKVAGTSNGELPHLMKFEGPGQGLSRTHAEVRIEAGQMVLEDLQSTNGTEVQLPGQQRRRMRSGEPIVLVPGTLIDFGEELHCTVEPSD